MNASLDAERIGITVDRAPYCWVPHSLAGSHMLVEVLRAGHQARTTLHKVQRVNPEPSSGGRSVSKFACTADLLYSDLDRTGSEGLGSRDNDVDCPKENHEIEQHVAVADVVQI